MKVEGNSVPGVLFTAAMTIAATGLVLCDNPEQAVKPTDKSPLTTPTKTFDLGQTVIPLPRETPPPGWKEVTIKRYDRVLLRLQIPQDWNLEEKDQEILVESEATRDLSQMVRILILTRLNPYESDTFAESIADERAVEDKDARSPLKLNVRGKEVLSFVRKNQFAGFEEHIFGFTVNGVGVAVIIDAPPNRIRDEGGNFQRILDHLEPISTSSQK